MNTILHFPDPLAAQPEHSGGKGANLARLTSGNFDVPPGFIVASAAYRQWLCGADWWRQAVRELPENDPAALSENATVFRDRLRSLPLPAAVATEIRHAVGTFPDGTCFAVRSSSTMEDLAEAAFAGLHDSFLNCQGVEAVLEAVRNCYLSLWHDRAIAYRHRHGFDHAAAHMAVVVQTMAPCDAAGVAFSMNPVTGDLGVAVISANYGLGESVVNGACEVDHWEVDKASGAVLTSTIADKSIRTVSAPTGGTADEVLDELERQSAVLSPEKIEAVHDLLKRAEAAFRFPQDIEWGFVGDRLVILQSRPITTIPPRWTRDESAERFPNVITPLTWDFVDRGFHRSMDHSFRLMGFPAFSGQWFGKHGHYIYGNQNAVELYAGQFPFALNSLDDLPVLIPQLRERFHWVQDLPVHWSRDLDYYLLRLGEFMAEPLEGKSIEGLWQFVQEVNDHGSQYFLPNIAISVTQGVLYKLLSFLLRELFGAAEVPAMMDGLLAFCETKTGTINKELYELAQMVRRDPLLEQRLRSKEGNRALWESGVLPIEHGEFHQRFLLLMRDHGHREIDFDLYQPLWTEVPWVALDQIRLILDAPVGLSPAQRERELKIRSQAAEFSLIQRLPKELHFFIHEIIRLARIYTSLDDLEHYQTTRLAVPMRKGLRMLGQRLVERGILADPMDIFFAREVELDAAIAADDVSTWRALSGAVAREKASWEEARRRTPGWEPDAADGAVPAPVAGTELSGLPGSAGVVEGEVYIVSGPQDFAGFPPGAILVARTTNPAWTPLFYTASGVITGSGGPLSHGAVTAREMCIPAVMSVRECLSSLGNGMKVRVDGTHGKVQILSPELAERSSPQLVAV
ncbi:MAG: PEP-utilizing enzyme [Verrucomicrobia bacterium]|nr:PEP-utilizing enzyme [Verrucomicrobiota bacterium]MDA1005080.1 PEP-utilizing enzyme [Verrucomicrobiota bacterium]